MINDIELLGEESQEYNSNYIMEISNLLELDWEWKPIKLPINETNKQQALDILLLELAETKVNAISKISYQQRFELLESLLKNGANVNSDLSSYYSYYEKTVLENFLFSGPVEVIELLLSHGANVSIDMLTSYSSLPFYATMRLLMNHGVDLNMCDSDGNILHRILDIKQIGAAYYDVTRNHVEFLLENGVSPSVSDSNGIYPLDLAISVGNKEVEMLLKGYNAKQSGRLVPIDPGFLLLAESGKLNKVDYSLQDILLNISPDKYSQFGILEKNAYRVAELLLEAGAVITKDMPVIAYASSLKNSSLVELYLNHGANPSAVNEAGENGLMIAVLKRDMPIIHLLLNDGRVDVNSTSIRLAEDEDEEDTHLNVLDRALISEFWDSSIKEDFEIARLLIEHGAIIGQASLKWHPADALEELKKFQNIVQNSKASLTKKGSNKEKVSSGNFNGDDLIGMHDNVQGAFAANNQSIMLQGDMVSDRLATYQAPLSNSPFDQELINLQDRVNYYEVLAARQKHQQQSRIVEMSPETVRFLSNIFQLDNSSSCPRSTISQSYQPNNNTDLVPLYDVSRQSKTVNTDSRGVGKVVDYLFSAGTSSASRSGSFFSRIDFSPEQNGVGIGVAETDFYGRPVTRDSVVATMPTTTQFTPSYVFSELFGISTAYGNPTRPAAGAMAINSSEGYTDSRVRQAVDFPFVSRSGTGIGAGSFWSLIDFAPEQSGAGIRVAETDFYGRYLPSPSLQDEIKTVKIYDVKSGVKIDSNNHGLKKDSFVRNGKEVTSYRNSLGQFTKKPLLYNYSINTQIPLINLGGQEYSLVLIDSRGITLGDTEVQIGMTAYTKSPHIFSGFNKGLNASMGWNSGILVGSTALGDGSNLSAHILETLGIAGFNIGKSGLGAKLGFKGSLANVKYIMPISEKCWIGYCFEGDATLEAGLGISSKAEIGLSNKKVKSTLGLGAIAQAELSVDLSISKNKEYLAAQQKRTEQIQAKYDHFNAEIKKYSTDVISKISMMDLYDFGNHQDFESILLLAKEYSKR